MADKTAREWALDQHKRGRSRDKIESVMKGIGAVDESNNLTSLADTSFNRLVRSSKDRRLKEYQKTADYQGLTSGLSPEQLNVGVKMRGSVPPIPSTKPDTTTMAPGPRAPIPKPDVWLPPVDVKKELAEQRQLQEEDEERYTLPGWLPRAAGAAVKQLGKRQREEALLAFERLKKVPDIDLSKADVIEGVISRVSERPEEERRLDEPAEGLSGFAKRVASAPVRTAGMGVGAAKEVVEGVPQLLMRTAAMGGGEEPGVLPPKKALETLPETEIEKAFKETERDIHTRLASSSARLASAEEAAKEGTLGTGVRLLKVVQPFGDAYGPIDNLPSYINTGFDASTDMRDVLLSLAVVAGQGLVGDVTKEDLRQNVGQFLKQQYGEGEQFGRILSGGILGGTAAILWNPVDALETRPISTLLTLLPVIKAYKTRHGATPEMQRLLDSGDDIISALREEGPVAKIMAPIRNRLFRTRKDDPGAIAASINRLLSDAFAQATPEQLAYLDEVLGDNLLRNPAAIRGFTEDLARYIEQAEGPVSMTADEFFQIIERIPSEKMISGRELRSPIKPPPLPEEATLKTEAPTTQTPAGLSATKAVDKRGEPITVYHGTSDEFGTFDLSESMGEYGVPAVFFTDSRSVAEGYIGRSDKRSRQIQKNIDAATNEFFEAWDMLGLEMLPPDFEGARGSRAARAVERQAEWARERGNITPEQEATLNAAADKLESAVYERQKMDEAYDPRADTGPEGRVVEAKLNIENPHVVDADGLPDWNLVMEPSIRTAIKDGRDGVIIKNVRDNATDSMEKSTVYVVFDTGQIRPPSPAPPTQTPAQPPPLPKGATTGPPKFAFERVSTTDRISSINRNNRYAAPRAERYIQLFEEAAPHEVQPVVEALSSVRAQIADAILPRIKGKLKKNRRGMSKTEGDKLEGQIRRHEDLLDRIDEALSTPDGFVYRRSGDQRVLRPREGHPMQRESVQIPVEWSEAGQKKFSPETFAIREAWTRDPVARRELARKFFSEEEIASQPRLNDPVVLAQAELLEKRVTPFEVEAVIRNPKLKERFGDLYRLTQNIFKEGDLIASRSSPEAIQRKLQTEKLRAGSGFLSEEKMLRLFVNALLDDSVQRLRSPGLRQEIAKRIVSGKKRKGKGREGQALERGPVSLGVDTIDGLLKDMAKSHYLEQAFEYVIKDPETGTTINLLDEMMETMAELPVKEQRKFIGETVRQVGEQVAYQSAEARFRAAMLDDARIWGHDVGTASQVADNLVRRVILEDRPLPLWLNRLRPKELTDQLVNKKERYVSRLVDEGGLTPEQAGRAIDILSSRITNNYEPISPRFPALKEAMPKAFAEGTNLMESQSPSVQSGPVGVAGIHRDFQNSAGWLLESLNQVNQGLDNRLMTMMKANLTVANPATHINNVGANVLLQATNRGKTPFGVLQDLHDSRSVWRAYKNGTLAEMFPDQHAQLERRIRSIERSDLIDSDLLEAEFGGLEFGTGEVGRGGAKKFFDETIGRAARAAGKAYSYGDQIFKFDEALRNSVIIEERMGAMSPGESIYLKVSSRTWVEAKKNVDGSFDMIRFAKGQKRKSAKSVSPERVDEVVSRAATQPAYNLFVNYADVPNYIHMLRQTRLGGFVSPFLSWAYKTMDKPIKGGGGIGAHLLVGDGSVYTPTNSSAVNRVMIDSASKLSLRRAAVYNAARQAMMEASDEELRELFKWMPDDIAMVYVQQMADPAYAKFMDLNSMNSLVSTMTLFRVGAHAAEAGLGASAREMSALYPYQQPPWAEGYVSPAGSKREIEAYLKSALDDGKISEEVYKERVQSLKDYDPELDLDLSLYDEDTRKNILERRRLHEKMNTKTVASFDDYLDLIGMSGHPMIEALVEIGQADRRQQEVSWEDVARKYGAVLIGGLPHKLFNVGAAAIDPYSPVSTRQFSFREDPKESMKFIEFAIGTLLGKMPRVRNIEEQTDKKRKKVQKALNASLAAATKKRIEGMEKANAYPSEIDAVERDLNRLQDVVDDIMEKTMAEQGAFLDRMLSAMPKKEE